MRRWWLLLVVTAIVVACSDNGVEDEAAAHAEAEADQATAALELRSVARGMSVPLVVADPDDGTDRLFIVDQTGQILVLEDGSLAEEPFLDISERMVEIDPSYDERGLLGLAFHPGFSENGRFFVYYSAPLSDDAPDGWDHTSHISEFRVSNDSRTADMDSERVLMEVDQPYSNHNAGQIAFGPDRLLYIPLGDGGNAGDVDAEGEDLGRPEMGNAQTVETPLGSILRIDVDGQEPYEIPPDNVFANDDGVDEIYAYGFRNPYGLSFDLETGEMYVADAGQARYEEVSRVEPGGNHGWNIREGTHCFNPDDFLNPPDECPDTGPRGEPLIAPVVEYERGPESGSVVVPAVMYRGEGVPALQGRLVFGDYGSIRYLPTGVLYVATPEENGTWPIQHADVSIGGDQPADLERFLLGVDQDSQGRLYVLTTREGGPTGETGEVFLVDAARAEDESLWNNTVLIVAGVLMLLAAVAAALIWRRRRDQAPEAAEG